MRVISATKLASVSLLALGLSIGVPAMAQQAPGSAPGATPGAAQSATPSQGMQRSDIKDKLDQAGIKDRKEFKGHLVKAQSAEGQPVLLVFGPEDMKADKSVDNFSQDKIRGELTKAGFSNVNFVQDAQMVRGQLKEDQQVLAISAKSGGWQPTAAQAQNQTPNLDRFKKDLDQVGLDNRDEFKGKLLRAQAGGDTLFLIVGPKDFKGDKSVDLSAADLSKLQQQGFQTVDVAQKVRMVHGKLDKADVIALAGHDLTGGPTGPGATTGSGMNTGAGAGSPTGAGSPMGTTTGPAGSTR
jgi:hypothetical protein